MAFKANKAQLSLRMDYGKSKLAFLIRTMEPRHDTWEATLQYDKVFSLREGHQKFTFTEKFLFSANGAPYSTVLQLLHIKRMDCQRNYL